MSAKQIKSIFRIGDDLTGSTVDKDNNTITFQTGDATANRTVSEAEQWGHIGLASLPTPPKDGNAAQGITITRSDYDVVIATRDTRFQKVYQGLKPGETCLYATGSDGLNQGRVLLKADGSINLLTRKDNKESGVGMGLFISASGDSVSAITSSGTALVLTDEISLFCSNGSLTIGAETKIASTGKVSVSGSSIILGSADAKPVITLPDLEALISALTPLITALSTVTAGTVASLNGPASALTASLNALKTEAAKKRTTAD